MEFSLNRLHNSNFIEKLKVTAAILEAESGSDKDLKKKSCMNFYLYLIPALKI